MKKTPCTQRLALLMALLTLAGPATFVAARPGGDHGGHGGGDHGGPRQAAAVGTVASIDASTTSFVLHLDGKKSGRRQSQPLDITVHTDAETAFSLGDGTAGSFADVAVGLRALVKGSRNEDGSLAAQMVALKAARPPHEAGVKGVIDAVDADTASFLLAAKGRGHQSDAPEVLVHTTDGTVFKNEDGTDASFADLAEGVEVDARGTLNADGSFQASAVRIHNEDDEPHPVKLAGVVDSVDAATSSFSLSPGVGREDDHHDAPSILVRTDANTVFTKADGSAGSFADVVVGARAAVVGSPQDHGLLATAVRLLAPEPPHEVAVRGTVASVDPASESFVLKPGDARGAAGEDHPGIVVHTGDTTAFQKGDGTPASFADVVVGARVGVKGTASDDHSIAASLVVIAGEEPPHDIALGGTVESIDAATKSFLLKSGDPREVGPAEHPSVVIHTGDDTAFVKPDGSAGSFADLVVGARAGVKGTPNADHSVNAKVVAIAGEEPPHEVGVVGVVVSVDAATQSFTIRRPERDDSHPEPAEIVIHTDERTVFTKADAKAGFGDVAVDAVVKCLGTLHSDGSLQASRVAIFVPER